MANRHVQRHSREDDEQSNCHHGRHRRGIHQVLNRERRDRLSGSEMVAGEEDLHGLAGEQPERRDASNGIASQERAERPTER